MAWILSNETGRKKSLLLLFVATSCIVAGFNEKKRRKKGKRKLVFALAVTTMNHADTRVQRGACYRYIM